MFTNARLLSAIFERPARVPEPAERTGAGESITDHSIRRYGSFDAAAAHDPSGTRATISLSMSR